jgi:hypothetical protein
VIVKYHLPLPFSDGWLVLAFPSRLSTPGCSRLLGNDSVVVFVSPVVGDKTCVTASGTSPLVFACCRHCRRLQGNDSLVLFVSPVVGGKGTGGAAAAIGKALLVVFRNCLVPFGCTSNEDDAVVGDVVIPQNSCCIGLQKGDTPRKVFRKIVVELYTTVA